MSNNANWFLAALGLGSLNLVLFAVVNDTIRWLFLVCGVVQLLCAMFFGWIVYLQIRIWFLKRTIERSRKNQLS